MAHTRKDTLTAPPEWWKHLRPYNKRVVAKRERRAAKKVLKELPDKTTTMLDEEGNPIGM